MTIKLDYKKEILKDLSEISPDNLVVLYKFIHLFKEEVLEKKKTSIDFSVFCGKWKDDRDADEIVAELLEGRSNNTRSEKFDI